MSHGITDAAHFANGGNQEPLDLRVTLSKLLKKQGKVFPYMASGTQKQGRNCDPLAPFVSEFLAGFKKVRAHEFKEGKAHRC
jgi:hypothetical protein